MYYDLKGNSHELEDGFVDYYSGDEYRGTDD